jgi:competence protein ComEA
MVLDLDRRYLWAAAVVLLLLVFAGGMKYGDMSRQNQNETEIVSDAVSSEQEVPTPKEEEIIQVYVTGAVQKPGVYRLQSGARVYDAVNMAEALPTANLGNINLAQKIIDEQAIVVPKIGEDLPINAPSGGLISGSALVKSGSTGKVNINSATAQELDGLPGIGPTLAQRIIEYRTSHGVFERIEDINEVSGIGDKKFADIKDLITVR